MRTLYAIRNKTTGLYWSRKLEMSVGLSGTWLDESNAELAYTPDGLWDNFKRLRACLGVVEGRELVELVAFAVQQVPIPSYWDSTVAGLE